MIVELNGVRLLVVDDTPNGALSGCRACCFHSSYQCTASVPEERTLGIDCIANEHHYELAEDGDEAAQT